jgi:hypothetical protein
MIITFKNLPFNNHQFYCIKKFLLKKTASKLSAIILTGEITNYKYKKEMILELEGSNGQKAEK